MTPLLAAADRATTEHSDLRMLRGYRWSGRQSREIPMDGVVGTITVAGDLTALAPWFLAGEWLHIGSQTSAGLGWISVSFPEVSRR
jgi:hypothetical protein